MKKVLSLMVISLLLSACSATSPPVKENVPSADYQRCLDAEKMGGGERVAERCGKLSQEIQKAPH